MTNDLQLGPVLEPGFAWFWEAGYRRGKRAAAFRAEVRAGEALAAAEPFRRNQPPWEELEIWRAKALAGDDLLEDLREQLDWQGETLGFQQRLMERALVDGELGLVRVREYLERIAIVRVVDRERREGEAYNFIKPKH